MKSRPLTNPLLAEAEQRAGEEVLAAAEKATREKQVDRAVRAVRAKDTIAELRALNEKFYWLCFNAGVGSKAHAFIEFNGLMSTYINVLARAATKGIDLHLINEHSGVALPVEMHDVKYMAEKLRCIFGPVLDSNPAAREVFVKALLGEDG